MKIAKKIYMYSQLMTGFTVKYSKVWDDLLEKILEEGELIEVCENTIVFGLNGNTYWIWISNFPFAYGYLWRINDIYVIEELQFRPSIEKIERLFDITSAIKKNEKIKGKDETAIYGVSHE